jgi:hypothetical protein
MLPQMFLQGHIVLPLCVRTPVRQSFLVSFNYLENGWSFCEHWPLLEERFFR